MENQNSKERFEELRKYKGFAQVFLSGKLTFGFVSPMAGYPNSPIPDTNSFTNTVRIADEGGIDVIWLRDVPFFDPNFGDTGQIYDPMVYGGLLAATTKRIAIGTAGMVLPLRDPLIVAKQAATLDQLSGGRFILGLASGDRQSEYPAFGSNFENRVERFREAREIIRKVTEEHFPVMETKYYGKLNGTIDLIPKPVLNRIPTIAIGRGGQDLKWIGENMDGWLWHGENARNVAIRRKQWDEANNGINKPYGYAHFFDLLENPDASLFLAGNYIQGGRNELIHFWKEQEKAGLSHAVLNPKPTQRPANEMLQEFCEFIIPKFR